MSVVALGAAAGLGAGLVLVGPRWGAVLGIALIALIGCSARDDAVRLALLLIPSIALVRRLTGGPDAYVPDDPLVILIPLLLIPPLLGLITNKFDNRLDGVRLLWLGFLIWSAFVTAALPLIVSLLIPEFVPAAALTVRAFGVLTVLVPALLGYAVFEGLYPRLPRVALGSVMVLAPLAAIYGLIQYTLDPAWDLAWLAGRQGALVSVGLPEHGAYRIFGTMEAPLPYALYLGLGLVALGAWTVWPPERQKRGSVLLRLAAVVLLVAALLLTATRSVLFGLPLVAAVGVLLVPRHRRGPALLIAGLMGAALIALTALAADRLYDDERQANRLRVSQVADDSSLLARLDLLTEFEQVLREPWGNGLGSSGEATRLQTGVQVSNLDNGYLALGQEVGVVGLGFFLLLLYQAVVRGRRALSSLRSSEGRVLGGSLLGVLYFALLLLTGSVLSIPSAMLFWIFLGLTTRDATLARGRTGSRSLPVHSSEPGVRKETL